MVVDNVLNEIDSEDLAIHVVWTPVLKADSYASSVSAQFKILDPRAVHYWDGDRNLGTAYGRQVELPRGRKFAWDIYFVYDQDTEWGDAPPQPADWAHQLGFDERSLDKGAGLRRAVEAALERSP